MSGYPISHKFENQPDRPVNETDRDDVVRRLNDAYVEGSVDAEQYDQLMDAAYGASKQGELVPVVNALPAKMRANEPDAVVQQGKPGEVTDARSNPRAMMLMTGASVVGIIAVVALLLLILL